MIDFDRYGGRSFVMAMGCAFVNTLLRWFDHLDNPTYGMIISVTVGAYIAKSAVDEHTHTRAQVQKEIAAKQAATPPSVVEQVDQ